MKRPRGELAPEGLSVEPDVHLRSRARPAPLPPTEDGRYIDRSLGVISGEAGAVARSAARPPSRGEAVELGRTSAAGVEASVTYYEQPVLQPPVWRGWIPTYFFVGGVAGGCMVLGAAAQLTGGRRLRPIVSRARAVASAGVVVSAGLLIADLGRPSRFIYMLRVFRPTSPMNVGTWILTGAGATASASLVLPRLGAKRLGDGAGVAAGVFGLGLSAYTAVLLVNTAGPAWQHGSRSLPPLFVASAAASAAAALDVGPALGRGARAVSVFGAVAKLSELAAGALYELALAQSGPSVVVHLRRGPAGALFRASQLLTVASLAASALGGRRLSGALGLVASLALRFAVTEAGRRSALDPRATFEPQRAGA